VEAVRLTVLAAQVPGAVVDLKVKAGDTVQAGQLLMRLDARAADQNAAAGDAQVQAARASLTVATQEFQRQQQLYEKRYISQAALERADAQYKATQAQVQAQLAQAGAARTQAGFYVVKAPYAGIVAELPVTLGDMAMPGRALVTVYDPKALRVSAAVPQTALPSGLTAEQVQIELGGRLLKPTQIQVLPTVDAATHTVTLRASLPAGTVAQPGQFARLSWAGTASPASAEVPRLYVPAQAVMRRAEMNVVYVLDAQGHPALRQVRVGPNMQDQVEVLSGLHAGEAVVLDPQAAARQR
jgi:membrane fusion protein, multidrug efflux system